ncbi:MAG: Bor family protein [Candidatus Nitrosoglobus sp.]|jgi:hypothetical protein
MRKLFLALSVASLISGCATQTFYVHGGGSSVPNKDTMQVFFYNGIGQEQEINAAQVCGSADKIAKVQVQQTFVNGLLTVITFGFFTPRDARVFCR